MDEKDIDISIALQPNAIIPSGGAIAVPFDANASEVYGHVLRYSAMCTVCRHVDLAKINLARAKDHKAYSSISKEFGVPVEALRKHFDNHYELSGYNKRIVNLQDNTSTEAKEIISKIFDGNVDLLDGTTAVLKSKAVRLNAIRARIEELTTNIEVDAAEDVDKQEFIMLNRLAHDIEDSIIKAYQIIDKKIFPFKKEELSNAVLSFKLDTLDKLTDEVLIVLDEFKKNPEYTDLINAMKLAISNRIALLEKDILKSGGIMGTKVGGTDE